MARKSITPTKRKSRKPPSKGAESWSVPLALRTRVKLDEATRNEMRRRLQRKLDSFTGHIDRVSLRLEDVNGPRGGIDIVCRIKVALRALPSVVVAQRAANELIAVGQAAEVARRAVRKTLLRADRSLPRGTPGKSGGVAVHDSRPLRSDDDGSLIGRRVGGGRANLERALARPEKQRRNAYVDTAAPGVSATDRRAGYDSTAARNTKRNTAGMAAALEDSRTTPSRKSTRKSKNRAKAATLLERKAQMKLLNPGARSRRGKG